MLSEEAARIYANLIQNGGHGYVYGDRYDSVREELREAGLIKTSNFNEKSCRVIGM